MLLKFLTALTAVFLTLGTFVDKMKLEASEVGQFNPIIGTSVTSESITSSLNPSVRDTHALIFGNNVYHVSQQSGSHLMPYAKMEGMVSTAKQVLRMGTLSDPALYLARGSRVTASNPDQDGRWLTAQRYWQACHVDSWDQIRTLYDIQNEYSVAMSMAFGRLYDRVLIAAALGNAYRGTAGSRTAVPLPVTQKFVALNSAGTEVGQITFPALNYLRKKMKENFVIQRGDMLVYACSVNETYGFLQSEQITNRDYTNNLVLASGEVAAFMGFLFAETELIPYVEGTPTPRVTAGTAAEQGAVRIVGQVASGGRTLTQLTANGAKRTFCFVAGKSLCFGINMNMMSRVSERDDLHYITQLYYAAEFGATRLEEVGVAEVWTKQVS